ncbi:MAG: carbon starvation CstA 5TM domain-containing protein, partial [Mucinivorans sp.]
IIKRLMIVVPLFALTFVVLQFDFGVIWRYFAWANQTLAVFTLWALTVYLVQNSRYYWITLIPALFMTAVCSTYILMADTGFGININISYIWGAVVTLGALGLFMIKQKKHILR